MNDRAVEQGRWQWLAAPEGPTECPECDDDGCPECDVDIAAEMEADRGYQARKEEPRE
jgi:hypothetical protein